MNEFSKNADVRENSSISDVGFQEIKPESSITPTDAKQFWKSMFSMQADSSENEPIESLENSKTDDLLAHLDNKAESIDDKSIDKIIIGKLTDEEKTFIKEKTHWSDVIIDHIDNMNQFDIFDKADLHEEIVDNRICLIKDIDMDFIDPKTQKTNRELMADEKAPIDPTTGEKIELHHIGQDYDSPLAELTENSEHGDGNDSILHDSNKESWRNDTTLKNHYNNVDRPNHWAARAQEG